MYPTPQQLTPAHFRRRTLTISAIALVVVIILWNVPLFSFIVYPLRLFVTFVHEAGHIIAAVLTGGEPRGFAVFTDGSGVAYTAGGLRAVILPAGYIGTALFGAGLFYIANTWSRTRLLTAILGYGLVFFSIIFTLPNLLSGFFALFIGGLMGAILVSSARRSSDEINLFILNVLALVTGFNAVLDVVYLITNPGARGGPVLNDAAAFSAAFAPWVPAAAWATIWAIASVLLLFTAVYFSVIRPPRR
ncbi:MAG: M50 family metallopeptidase [Anaerolineae bacterium]|jgi:hypothetical protein|nr:M50 family metallopeptidase [Anaerolineae bacterium]